MTYPLAQGHDFADGKLNVPRPAADNAGSWPAGSVFSNAQDLSRFVTAFLNDGMLDGKRALDPRAFSLMSSPHAKYPDSTESYGYGLTIRELRGVHVVEHSGSRMGYGSFIRMAPGQRVGMIILANRTGANLPATAEKASEIMLNLQAKADAAAKASLPVAAADATRVAGIYQNGDQRVEIVARENRLFLKRARGGDAPLVRHSDFRYAVDGSAAEYVVVFAGSGKAEYLHNGSRSYARVN
jgi:CubicO group peptidase (beta-lactamase class C family)